jgi:hypothetical protein
LLVRVFGGYDFTAKDLERSDFAEQGYKRGVPMGGDLKNAPAGKAPAFLVRAGARRRWREPRPHPGHQGLARTLPATRTRRSTTWHGQATASRARTASCRRSATPVNVKDASYTNAIGRAVPARALEGPELRSEATFVLLRPSDRNPDAALDDVRREVLRHQTAAGSPMAIQDRAYTSPIWYSPT